MGRRTLRTPLTGEVFGSWTVIEPGSDSCLCRCSCGVEKLVLKRNLLSEKSTRCQSCSNSLSGARKWPWMGKHQHRLRDAVDNAIYRCTNPDHPRYNDWGGRGIKVYDQWIDSPSLFVEYLATLDGWDNSLLVLDRIDNDKHYEPGNLRFVTRSVSQQNQRARKRKYDPPAIGTVFEWWTVLVSGDDYCLCRCRCGREKEVRISTLLNGSSTKCASCCKRKEVCN